MTIPCITFFGVSLLYFSSCNVLVYISIIAYISDTASSFV
nr:MAG TPA: hypothetical protein [Caudoviricetes sp.]